MRWRSCRRPKPRPRRNRPIKSNGNSPRAASIAMCSTAIGSTAISISSTIPIRRFPLMAILTRSTRPVFLLFVLAVASVLAQAPRVGTPAPGFTATDSHGQTHALDQYHGKYVVLEWHNQGCPYTRKHYESGNMQSLQKEWTSKGVVWFTVISSAPGDQGYVTNAEENAYVDRMHADPTAVLIDSNGKLGKLYDAKTTPEMYVID